jgi:hypothetical protein
MPDFSKISRYPIPADMNRNPVAVLAGKAADSLTGIVPIGVVEQLDGSYAVQVVVGTAAAALSAAQLISAVPMNAIAAVILPANPARKRHSLTNTGLNTVYLGFDGTVTSTIGIPVAAGATISFDPAGVAYTGAVYGVCAALTTSEIRGIIYT